MSWRQRSLPRPSPSPAPLTPIGELEDHLGDEHRDGQLNLVDNALERGSAEERDSSATALPTSPAAPAADFEIPWQIGDGKEEKAHVEPATLSDEITGKLADEPWQFKPYGNGDVTWLAAAQRRHMHRC